MKYTKTLLDHFRNPRNVGVIKDADGVGKVTSPVCGDIMELYIKVKDERIVDVKFQTFGCAAAIASSSVLTELIKGKKIDEALEITNKRIVDTLGGLPEEKLHCSVLAEDGVRKAIEDYKSKQKTTPQSRFAPTGQADYRS
ncbi:Fe-S cluster assembly scaffold protein NifU [candidate division WOR-3 bacterium JGI_Cruoil_03_44_89]|uniref:Fe-S cluster assembly scaffold protein NifU n=1 Tax=candidate division WOR-3 bacterium JGI_Cruoil_03_44_89 TaxID=1973748 RepID=A0A235BQH8_UNCW3|nr:MAG: Fe-S cluster assembly scaffold protein NifU [candidate division WOR-3 bacterium JGI_Cruoil_03_44_89]